MNKIFLLGNTGKAPEIISFENGKKLAKVSLATTEVSKDASGNKIENTTWHDLVFWGNIVEVVEKYVSKGTQLLVEGKLIKRSWDDKEGNKRYSTEVHVKEMTLLGAKKSQSDQPQQSSGSPSIMPDEGEDDLPF